MINITCKREGRISIISPDSGSPIIRAYFPAIVEVLDSLMHIILVNEHL